MEKTNIFKSKPPEVHFTIRSRVPYNKLLTNLACSSRTGEYWPSVVFVRTSLRSVRTATTSGQYSPVRPSRSVSKRLVLRSHFCGLWLVLILKLNDVRKPIPAAFKSLYKYFTSSSTVFFWKFDFHSHYQALASLGNTSANGIFIQYF